MSRWLFENALLQPPSATMNTDIFLRKTQYNTDHFCEAFKLNKISKQWLTVYQQILFTTTHRIEMYISCVCLCVVKQSYSKTVNNRFWRQLNLYKSFETWHSWSVFYWAPVYIWHLKLRFHIRMWGVWVCMCVLESWTLRPRQGFPKESKSEGVRKRMDIRLYGSTQIPHRKSHTHIWIILTMPFKSSVSIIVQLKYLLFILSYMVLEHEMVLLFMKGSWTFQGTQFTNSLRIVQDTA